MVSECKDSLPEMDFKDIIATIRHQDYLQNLTSSLVLIHQRFAKSISSKHLHKTHLNLCRCCENEPINFLLHLEKTKVLEVLSVFIKLFKVVIYRENPVPEQKAKMLVKSAYLSY